MDTSSQPSDDKRELDALRWRAYGPNPDIQADAAALARLEELEAARKALPPDAADTGLGEPAPAADGAPSPDPARTASRGGAPRSLWRRVTATRARRSSLVAGAMVVFLAFSYTMASLVGQPARCGRDDQPADQQGRVGRELEGEGATRGRAVHERRAAERVPMPFCIQSQTRQRTRCSSR